MSAEHTPGPWIFETVNTTSGICHKIGPFPPKQEGGRPRHACIYADYPSPYHPADQELEANARLIAAAPELLDAVELVLAWFEAEDNHSKEPDFYKRLEMCRESEDAIRAVIAKVEGGAA